MTLTPGDRRQNKNKRKIKKKIEAGKKEIKKHVHVKRKILDFIFRIIYKKYYNDSVFGV